MPFGPIIFERRHLALLITWTQMSQTFSHQHSVWFFSFPLGIFNCCSWLSFRLRGVGLYTCAVAGIGVGVYEAYESENMARRIASYWEDEWELTLTILCWDFLLHCGVLFFYPHIAAEILHEFAVFLWFFCVVGVLVYRFLKADMNS